MHEGFGLNGFGGVRLRESPPSLFWKGGMSMRSMPRSRPYSSVIWAFTLGLVFCTLTLSMAEELKPIQEINLAT